MNTSSLPKIVALTLSLALAGMPSASAAPVVYSPTDPTLTWDNTLNWSGGVPADGAGVTAQLIEIPTAQTLDLNGQTPTLGRLEVGNVANPSSDRQSWTISGAGTITLDNGGPAAELSTKHGPLILDSKILASGGVIQSGNYNLVISNADSVLNGGIELTDGGGLALYHAGNVGTSTITMAGTNTLSLGNGSADATFTNDFVVSPGSVLRKIYARTTGQLTLSGDISGTSGVRFSIIGAASSTRSTSLTGNNTYSGDTEIQTNVLFESINNFGEGSITFTTNAATLSYASGNTADITKSRDGSTSRTVALNVATTIDVGANDVTYANAVTGSGSLTKDGTGTLTLQGTNTMGAVTISNGMIIAESAGALGGAGNNVSAGANGELRIGGTTQVGINDFTLATGGKLSFQLDGFTLNSTTPLLMINGDQIGGGTVEIGIFSGSPLAMGSYTLFEATGSVAASFALNAGSSGLGSLEWDAPNNQLLFHAVPEPSVATLMILAFGIIGSRRLRKV